MLKNLKLKLMGAAIGLSLLGATLIGVNMVSAAGPSTTQTTPAVVQPGNEQNEKVGTEQVETSDPILPGGGHADQNGVNVQHDFNGIE